MLSLITLGAIALASVAQAQNMTTATPAQLELVEAQFNASGLNTPIDSGLALGIPLQAQALLQVVYGDLTIENGQAYTPDQLETRPRMYMQAAEGIELSGDYTLFITDFSAISDPDPRGAYLHGLWNSANVDGTTGQLSNGTSITYYATPGPLVGTGAHRYAWLVFEQPPSFSPPAEFSGSGARQPGPWGPSEYVQQSRLGNLVAASFFTVQNGEPTVAVVSTSAVNTATLDIPSASMVSSTNTAGASASSGVSPNNAGSSTGTGAASNAFSFSNGAAALGAVAGVAALFV